MTFGSPLLFSLEWALTLFTFGLLGVCILVWLGCYIRFAWSIVQAPTLPLLPPPPSDEAEEEVADVGPVNIVALLCELQKIPDRLEKQELALTRLTEALTIRLETHEHKTEQQIMKIRQEARIPTNGVGTIGGM